MQNDLWELVWGKAEIDPQLLAQAIEMELRKEELDFRTRLLIKDSTSALEQYWGKERLEYWLNSSRIQKKIEQIRQEDFGKSGFPRLREHLMERVMPEKVEEYLREIGVRIQHPLKLTIGGSIALILPGFISRATSDIDIVNEVPEPIRNNHQLLEELQTRYNLQLTHFQSHYLPANWEQRLEFQGSYGRLQVYRINPYDVFLGKLFSKRSKDLDDLRAVKHLMDKQKLERILVESCGSFMKDRNLRASAEQNWYIVFGDNLPQN